MAQQVFMPQKRKDPLKSMAPQLLRTAGTAIGSIYGGPVGGAIGGQIGGMAGSALNDDEKGVASGVLGAVQRKLDKQNSVGDLQKGMDAAQQLPPEQQALVNPILQQALDQTNPNPNVQQRRQLPMRQM